jgi:1-phosphofructokinase family hexose kinase
LVVTLTINPAIDRTLSVDRLAFEDRSYINSSRESAGGRGINAARVLHSFGGEALAVLTSGGDSGKRLENYLRCCDFRFASVPIAKEIRTNLIVTDRQGLTVSLNETGPEISKAELTAVERVIRDLLPQATWLMVCGSLPPGVPPAFYEKIIGMARLKKVKTLLDAGGAELEAGMEARPTVVTPNQHEAEHLLGRALLTRTHYVEAAQKIRAMGSDSVLLSAGSRGAVGAFREGLFEVSPPRVDAVCPIGAGDALAAGYVWAIGKKSKPPDALRWGVAAGTASAQLPGIAFANLQQAEAVYRQVEVRPVE